MAYVHSLVFGLRDFVNQLDSENWCMDDSKMFRWFCYKPVSNRRKIISCAKKILSRHFLQKEKFGQTDEIEEASSAWQSFDFCTYLVYRDFRDGGGVSLLIHTSDHSLNWKARLDHWCLLICFCFICCFRLLTCTASWYPNLLCYHLREWLFIWSCLWYVTKLIRYLHCRASVPNLNNDSYD